MAMSATSELWTNSLCDSGVLVARRPSASCRALSNESSAKNRFNDPDWRLRSAYFWEPFTSAPRSSDGGEVSTVFSLTKLKARNHATSACMVLSAATCSSTDLASSSERRPSTQSANRAKSLSLDSITGLTSAILWLSLTLQHLWLYMSERYLNIAPVGNT